MNGTRQKTLGKQLSQTLGAESRGEAPDTEPKEVEPLVAKPASESPALAEQLMEEVCDRENLENAWETRSRKQGRSWRRWDEHRRRQRLPT
jgi:RNA-directed DNA polymerase